MKPNPKISIRKEKGASRYFPTEDSWEVSLEGYSIGYIYGAGTKWVVRLHEARGILPSGKQPAKDIKDAKAQVRRYVKRQIEDFAAKAPAEKERHILLWRLGKIEQAIAASQQEGAGNIPSYLRELRSYLEADPESPDMLLCHSSMCNYEFNRVVDALKGALYHIVGYHDIHFKAACAELTEIQARVSKYCPRSVD